VTDFVAMMSALKNIFSYRSQGIVILRKPA
jgi:hypothetical protein